MSACLNWQEAYQAGAAVCGGKGYNLARLARYGFRVPRGFVLSAGAPVSEIRQGLEPESPSGAGSGLFSATEIAPNFGSPAGAHQASSP
jgi:phosphoenolpyruvate synthase/pyruvate phosphate dikinase